jgi:hypothetical protein
VADLGLSARPIQQKIALPEHAGRAIFFTVFFFQFTKFQGLAWIMKSIAGRT